MAHRGVRSRCVDSVGASLGHVRLPIVGTGEEHDQPVRRGRLWIGFVGELLDFRERDPRAECDVDTIADAWAEHGPAGLRGFDGFWSVVVLDEADGSVTAAVDYLSQKPLYVRTDEHAVAVASEPDAVACLGPTVLDRIYLSAVMKWGYCPETWRTPYQGIRRLGPGETVKLGPTGIEWLELTDRLYPTSRWDLAGELEAAVRRRVTSSDVPVSALVSGGLDSSIVYSMARRFGDVRPYHVENGEWRDCLEVAPDAVRVSLDGISREAAMSYMQEPVDLGSLLPQAALSDAVRRAGDEVVCLTGDGADELFGGYSRAARYDSQSSDVFHELVGWHLPRLDRVMMRNCIEVRSPFLARRVVEAALALPRLDRIDKRILREIASSVLPPSVCRRIKRALRTEDVESNRESVSRSMVESFVRNHEERDGKV